MSSETDVTFVLRDSGGQVFRMTEGAALNLAARVSDRLSVEAVLSGSERFTPVLFPGVQVLNGALAGLVSIAAGPLDPTLFGALWIGAVGGIIVVFAVPFLDKLKIDDVVGAIPAHLVCGIWGTLIVAWTNPGVPFLSQLIGVLAIGAFVFAVSLVIWLILKFTIGIRASEEEELGGLDLGELGLEAYPEFKR